MWTMIGASRTDGAKAGERYAALCTVGGQEESLLGIW